MLSRNLGEVYKKGLHFMSDLYERIDQLCKERNINITTMCKESGASRGSLTDLKSGRKQNLSIETLTKIAVYFGVSVDYLTGKEKAPILTEKDERDIARNLERIMSDLENSGDLMFDGNPMTSEARESMRNAIELGLKTVKLLNKETYTPKKYKKG